MKCKKIVGLLLAVVMILGLLPLSAMAAGMELGKTTEGTYVDTTAESNKSYEYTVTGSDGSTQTVQVPAASTDPTGNSITEHTGTGNIYYEKVTDPAHASGDGYLLVDTNTNQAVSTRPGVEGVTIQGTRITGDHTTAEWKVTTSADKMRFYTGTANDSSALMLKQSKDGTGAHKEFFGYVIEDDPWKNFRYTVISNGDGNFEPVVSEDTFKLFRNENERPYSSQGNDVMVPVYLNIQGTRVMGDKNTDHATAFTLYRRNATSTGTHYIVETTGLDKLLSQSFTESQYTTGSWNSYIDAKKDAEAAKTALANPYDEKTAADAALADIDNATRALQNAINGLTKKPETPDQPVDPSQCFAPEITWHRTWEAGNYREKPVQNVTYLEGQKPWPNITWNWDRVKELTASDPNPWNTNNGTSATWEKGYTGGTWTDASVRRFTGTFTWPAGVGMDGTMTIQSVNDSDYQFIYDYINADPDLKARYGNAKVLPINDDMYVFISKVSDGDPSTWSQAQASDHLMFWTGTSGKGIWSQSGNTSNDWGRREPARFEGKNATPAYHGTWPNLVDTGDGTNANVQNWTLPSQENPMAHTDNWYTLTDTNAMKSTLHDLYGANADLAGEQMRIDIYAFDNSESGGMDELMLTLCAAEQTTAQVQVNYWLDDVGATSLGSTVMTRDIGDVVNLPKGTNTNELNHKKAEAILEAGESANVSNGVQREPDYVVKKSGNVINVVYTRKIQGVTYYTYDFGVQNEYLYKDTNESNITSVSVECKSDTINASYSGHDITLTYTPKDALGSAVNATLVVQRRNNTNRYPITIIPASNVLYEENFITGDWSKSDCAPFIVADNEATVYGYTTAQPGTHSYDTSMGANGVYTASIDENTKKTSDLSFSFRGLGLDLIGSCGPDYGTLAVKIMQGSSIVKTFVVNTSYADGTIHQVPLLHTQKGLLAGAQYDVTVRGMYMAPAAVATFSESGSQAITPELYEALIDLGLSDEDMENVEFVNASDNIPADAPMLMSAQPMAAVGSQTVAVDGFRVYRSTEKADVAYAKNEQNLIYTNVMDEAITGNFYAYVEQSTEDGSYNTADYEQAGGPENELYLRPGTGISFRLKSSGTITPYAQVSLRAVNDATAYNNISLDHSTEMYYEVAVNHDLVTIANTGDNLLAIGNLKTNCPITSFDDAFRAEAVKAVAFMLTPPSEPEIPAQFQVNFVLTDGAVWTDGSSADQSFTLTADDGGLTAPAVQAPHGKKLVGWQAVEIDKLLKNREILTVQYLQENYDWTDKEAVITFQPIFEAEEGTAFEPARFDLSTRVSGLFHKRVTLTAKTSTDVAYLTVNGEKITADNTLLVKLGLSKTYTFKATQTVGRKDTATFEVIAYNADGIASAAHTVSK